MEKLIAKNINKPHSQGLADKDKAVFIALDDRLFSNKAIKNEALELSKIFEIMNIYSILFAEPAEPYKSIINEPTDNNYSNHRFLSYRGEHKYKSSRESPPWIVRQGLFYMIFR